MQCLHCITDINVLTLGVFVTTIRVSEKAHKILLQVAGGLQRLDGKAHSLDDAVIRLGILGNLSLSTEIGLTVNSKWSDAIRKQLKKEEAFLYFWGTASVAKVYRDSFGFDSPDCYVWSYLAKIFGDYLMSQGGDIFDENIRRNVSAGSAPSEVTIFLKESFHDGFGNWVANGKFAPEEVLRYLYCILAYDDGKWNIDSVSHLRQFLTELGI